MTLTLDKTLMLSVMTFNKKASYRKQIARQHSWSTLNKFCSHVVWSPYKMWLLFLILCTRT